MGPSGAPGILRIGHRPIRRPRVPDAAIVRQPQSAVRPADATTRSTSCGRRSTSAISAPARSIVERNSGSEHLHVIIKGSVEERDGDEVEAVLGPKDSFDARAVVHGAAGARFIAAEETLCYLAPQATDPHADPAQSGLRRVLLFGDFPQARRLFAPAGAGRRRFGPARPRARCAHPSGRVHRRRGDHRGGGPADARARQQCAVRPRRRARSAS